MKALFVLLGVVLFSVGCAGYGPKDQWDNFANEMNQDIILKSDFLQVKALLSGASATTKPAQLAE